MTLSINQNIMAMNSYRNLSATQGSLGKSLEKLSSGFRINRAADDAAGLAISEGLRSQVGGNKQAVRNAQDGISVVQTAEGALQEVHAILQRQRDLAVQGANDSNSAAARNNIMEEMNQLTEELGRIAEATNFNGTQLLDGSVQNMQFQVGANGDKASRITVDLTKANVANIANALGGAPATTATAATAGSWVSTAAPGNVVDGTNMTVSDGDGVTVSIAGTAGGVAIAAQVTALNADAKFTAKYTAAVDNGNLKITAKAAGANAMNFTVSNGGTAVAGTATAGTKAIAVGERPGVVDVSTHASAQTAIGLIDTQIGNVSSARAVLGAVQNRFEHTINNLNVAVENLSASESRIRDTDMASEMMQFTRNQILSQAGTSMLAQANQVPQSVLSLLR
ncbi:MAG: flagellin [Actinomycetaceae bacterium]|nr:flagellin [Actinomycetaceae bacterium]